jgi:hypothetical protein
LSSIADLRPGDVGFGKIGGGVGLAVSAGQLLLGEGFHVGKVNIEHVFVVTSVGQATPVYPVAGEPFLSVTAVEAMPRGARETPIEDRWTPEYAYVRLPEDYPGQGEDAAAIARAMIGTPYSWRSYFALGLWRFGWKTPRLEKWINRRKPAVLIDSHSPWAGGAKQGIMLPREAICSVLADQSWALTGKQVMPAGTPHQCVTPGALAAALLETEGAQWIWPR